MSGTIVERRDHVLTTFFSFRSFRAATFSCRWPSTNGPFLSERGIVPVPPTPLPLAHQLLVHPAQLDPLRAPHLAKSPHGSGDPVRQRAEGTDKPRPLLAGLLFDQHRPSRLADPVQHRL